MCVLSIIIIIITIIVISITIFSSNINEVIRTILNSLFIFFFFYEKMWKLITNKNPNIKKLRWAHYSVYTLGLTKSVKVGMYELTFAYLVSPVHLHCLVESFFFFLLFSIFFSSRTQKHKNANKRISYFFLLRCFLSAFIIFVYLFAFLCFCLVAFLCFLVLFVILVLFGAFLCVRKYFLK